MSKKKQAVDVDSLTFEESLAQLEQIVAQLEGGKLGLAESLAAYEQGVQRLNGCYQMLQSAERRIELVQNVDASGRAKSVPLEDDPSTDLGAKLDARSRRRSAGAAPRAERVDDPSSLF